MCFSGKMVLVFGTGISGIAAARLLLKRGAQVILFDGCATADRASILENFADAQPIELYAEELPERLADSPDLVVLSPGVPTDLPLVRRWRASGIPILGEVELAYRCASGDLLAITGTNGKTTTTALLGQIMTCCFGADRVRVVGNIGFPYAAAADSMTDHTVTVAEVSSFQLETAEEFHPDVSAILNITPDHLDRHHTMENYVAAKLRIAKNQTKDQVCVLNYDNAILREHAGELRARILYFSGREKLSEGFYLDRGMIYCADGHVTTEVIATDRLRILGRHNYENVMAAAAMAASYGVPVAGIRESLAAFSGVEHRIEYVAEKGGVRFYNDSKATNPDAAIMAIRAMNRPICLIGGGYDKGSAYGEWIKSFEGKVKVLVLIGQTREKIAAEARANSFFDYVFADSLGEALTLCCERAVFGDAVLLSPACASWDMFPDYEARGEMFKKMVGALKE